MPQTKALTDGEETATYLLRSIRHFREHLKAARSGKEKMDPDDIDGIVDSLALLDRHLTRGGALPRAWRRAGERSL